MLEERKSEGEPKFDWCYCIKKVGMLSFSILKIMFKQNFPCCDQTGNARCIGNAVKGKI